MTKEELYSDTKLVQIIENEGLGYAIQYYLSAERIENEVTKRLWTKAKTALDDLTEYLELDE